LQPSAVELSKSVSLSQVATPTLPTLRADLLRAQELVRLTGKAGQAGCEDPDPLSGTNSRPRQHESLD